MDMPSIKLLQKLNEFRKTVGIVRKDATNPFYNSKYATLESVLNTIEKPLNDLNLGYIQLIDGENLKTIIYDADSDEKIESSIKLIVATPDMQKLGSAITYARRYSLVAMLGLEQEDDDGNATIKNIQTHNQTQTHNQFNKPQKTASQEYRTIGDPCPSCDKPVKILTSKAGKQYWKCECGEFGFNIKKGKDDLDEEIPF